MTWFNTPSLTATIDGVTVRHTEPGVWFIPPGVPIQVRYDVPGELVWLHFTVVDKPGDSVMDEWSGFRASPDRAAYMGPAPKEVWDMDMPSYVPSTLLSNASQCLTRVVSCWQTQTPQGRIDANGLLSGFISQWVAEERQARFHQVHDDIDQRLIKAERHAREHLADGLSVDDLAQVAGYDRAYFSTLYKSRRDESPGKFLKRIMMEQAVQLLVAQQLPTYRVSQLVGYPSATAFCRAFKQWYKMTPRDYVMSQDV